MKALAGPLAWAIVGALALYVLAPRPEPVAYPHVIVPAARITQLEPDKVVQWKERIVYRIIQPTQVATAYTGGEADVATFCRPTVLTLRGDTAAPRDTTVLLRSVEWRPGGLFRSDHYALTGPLSTGGLRRFDIEANGKGSARVVGGELLIRSSRWWWVEDAVTVAIIGGAGYLAGSLLGGG